MSTHPQPQGPVAVERIELAFDGLPDELDVQSSFDSGWITISYRKEIVARYLPVRQIAEIDIHFVVGETQGSNSEPDDVTDSIVRALSLLKKQGFEICHEYAERLDIGRFCQSLVLHKCPVSKDALLELTPMILAASQYAIDLAADQDTVEKSSD